MTIVAAVLIFGGVASAIAFFGGAVVLFGMIIKAEWDLSHADRAVETKPVEEPITLPAPSAGLGKLTA